MRTVVKLLFVPVVIGAALGLTVWVDFKFAQGAIARSWSDRPVAKVRFDNSVNVLHVVPLVNWHVARDELLSEPGVSLLLEADDKKILFDVGFNQLGSAVSPLSHNSSALGLNLTDVEMIFLSHRHRDHMGGAEAERSGRLAIATTLVPTQQVPVISPTVLENEPRTVTQTFAPTLIGGGVATTGPIARQLIVGRIDEQALVINLAGKGLVLVVGCGHQTVPKLVQVVRESFDEPIHAIVGDVHFPVPRGRLSVFGIDAQRYLASGEGPFSPVGWGEVEEFAKWADENNVALYLGGHDTSDEALSFLAEKLGDKMHRLTVGQTVCLSC